MIGHIGPQAAIDLAKQTAVKYQLSSDVSPDAFVEGFMKEIEPIVTHEAVTPSEYLQAIRVPAKLELVNALQDELSQRRVEFMKALISALDARAAK
jgi:hypothetical protein